MLWKRPAWPLPPKVLLPASAHNSAGAVLWPTRRLAGAQHHRHGKQAQDRRYRRHRHHDAGVPGIGDLRRHGYQIVATPQPARYGLAQCYRLRPTSRGRQYQRRSRPAETRQPHQTAIAACSYAGSSFELDVQFHRRPGPPRRRLFPGLGFPAVRTRPSPWSMPPLPTVLDSRLLTGFATANTWSGTSAATSKSAVTNGNPAKNAVYSGIFFGIDAGGTVATPTISPSGGTFHQRGQRHAGHRHRRARRSATPPTASIRPPTQRSTARR